MKVLIVDDDDGIIDFVRPELKHEGFETDVAKTGREALEKIESEKPDIVLLDVMLPEINGLEVLRRIRQIGDLPVILVTARGETLDKINGLNSGADDYISKPFDIEELLARINAVLRRVSRPAQSNRLSTRDVSLDVKGMTVTVKGNVLSLSKTEFQMLRFFMENAGRVLSRDMIIDSVWGKDHFIDVNTVDVYVGYLRGKIDQPCGEEYIKTVRGAGYVWK